MIVGEVTPPLVMKSRHRSERTENPPEYGSHGRESCKVDAAWEPRELELAIHQKGALMASGFGSIVACYRRFGFGWSLLLLLGCTAEPVVTLCPVVSRSWEQGGEALRRRKLDVLFVIDNTGSMVAKQPALVASLQAFLGVLDNEGHQTDYHIGFATTDVGSWVSPGQPWTMTAGACDSFAGDDGILQAVSCLDRKNGSAAAAQACSSLCPDRRFLPMDGTPFLSGYRGFHNVPSAMELDPKTGLMMDRGPEYALRCMGLVGDGGCGLSSPLAAMQRALDGHRPENRGFLREDASLLVVIVTDKDDCSVQASRRAENDPHTRNCTSPDSEAAADCFDPAFRCLARNLRCAEPLNTAGPKTGCQERTDSYLEPEQNYVNFLRTIKPRQNFTIIGLWPEPSVDGGGPVVVVQDPKIAGSAGLRTAGGAQAACQSSSDPNIVGQPQLRLNRLMSLLTRPGDPPWTGSICEPQNYRSVLTSQIAYSPICRLPLGDLPQIPLRHEDGTPACVIGDVDRNTPDAVPARAMPVCGSLCCDAMDKKQPRCYGLWSDEVVSACASEPESCYCIVSPESGDRGTKARYGVWRPRNAEGPSGTSVNIRCAMQSESTCMNPT